MEEGGPRVQGQLDPRPRGWRTHLCVCCGFPVAVYGRCAPCLHVYCLTCAADMAVCLICQAPITKLERIPADSASIFISPATLQGYRTEADLARATQQLHAKLMAMAQGGGVFAPAARGGPVPLPLGPPPPPAAAAAALQQQQHHHQHQQANRQPRPGFQPHAQLQQQMLAQGRHS